jgi:hypothetical protein
LGHDDSSNVIPDPKLVAVPKDSTKMSRIKVKDGKLLCFYEEKGHLLDENDDSSEVDSEEKGDVIEDIAPLPKPVESKLAKKSGLMFARNPSTTSDDETNSTHS